MAKVEDCPGFETFGADVKAARKARRLARKALAEMVGIEWRYLANIENKGTIPSLPVVIQNCVPKNTCRSSRARLTGLLKLNSQRRKKRGMPENHPLFSSVCGDAEASFIFLHFFPGKSLFCG